MDHVERAARAMWARDQQIFWEGSGTQEIPWERALPSARSLQIDLAQAVLDAFRDAGFVLVPVKPTKEMLRAGARASAPHGTYRAMIAAAQGFSE